MGYTGHIFKTKGFPGAFSRLGQIINRFGVTSKKIDNCLDTFINITDEFGYNPTLCATAILLDSHSEVLQKLNQRNAEVAIHGYIHTDYTTLSEEEINDHFKKSKELFKNYSIPFSGFRFPYLSYNELSLNAVRRNGFLWSSNQAICWNVLDKNTIAQEKWENFQRVIDTLYTTRDASNYLSLPKIEEDCVDIPVSVPDDEIIIDRLGITDERGIGQIWHKILDASYVRGELFTLQSHHERVPFYGSALRSLLKKAKDLSPKVWIVPLKEIAAWWKEKDEFNFQITSQKKGCYHIKAHCSPRATILVKKPHTGDSSSTLFDHYNLIKEREFDITSDKKPIIGIAHHSPQGLINFLRQEGFMTEVSSDRDEYALYLDTYYTFNADDEKKLIDIIEDSPSPLLRFWRWPNKAQSALSITGDIDSITLIDFVRRYLAF
ncbi:MAG: polysaccharide deacetylase family protein [bacterium]